MSSDEEPVAWLRAQVEARLALAREAGGGEWQAGCTCEGDCPGYPACEEVIGDGIHIYSEGGHDAFQAGHIAANDPQDTIARCEAELAILDACHQGIRNGRAFLAEEIIRLLAGGYKHRPGFPEEWKPGVRP